MKYRKEDLIKDVRVVLDENRMDAETASEVDDITLTLDALIASKLLDASKTVILDAPLDMLGKGLPFGKSISWYGKPGQSGGYILLPKDFLRLVIFQMSDWSYPLTDLISPTSELYALQGSRYPGIRGCPQRPVAALTNTAVGMTLEFWSCEEGENAAIKQAQYIPEPRFVEDSIHLPHKLKSAVVYYTAYLCAQTLEEADEAARILGTYNTLIQNQNS